MSLVPISSFCKTGSGTTPSRSNETRYYGGTIPWVKSGELRETDIFDTQEKITEAALAETSLKMIPASSLLVAMYGATVGRVGILRVTATTNQAVCHIVPDPDRADVRYMFYVLQWMAPQFVSRGVGGAQPNISQKIVQDALVRLPLLDEQRRVAAILDRADALRRMRQITIDRINALKLAMFEREFGDLTTWPQRQIGEICDVKGGKRLPKGDEYSGVPTQFRYVRVSDIKDGEIDESGLLFLKPETQKKIRRYTVSAGDIVISIAGSIGQIAPVRESLEGVNLTENAAKLVPKNGTNYLPEFLALILQTPLAQTQIASQTGQVTIGKLALFRIERIVVPLPPLEIQKMFMAKMRTVQHVGRSYKKHSETLNQLFSSLQRDFLGGETSLMDVGGQRSPLPQAAAE